MQNDTHLTMNIASRGHPRSVFQKASTFHYSAHHPIFTLRLALHTMCFKTRELCQQCSTTVPLSLLLISQLPVIACPLRGPAFCYSRRATCFRIYTKQTLFYSAVRWLGSCWKKFDNTTYKRIQEKPESELRIIGHAAM